MHVLEFGSILRLLDCLIFLLATSCEELTHWKRLWCREGLGAGGERDDRGWDGWMASPTRWTWVWVNSGSWWWTGRPGMLRFMGSQRVGHNWVTELNRNEFKVSWCKTWIWPFSLLKGHTFSRCWTVFNSRFKFLYLLIDLFYIYL